MIQPYRRQGVWYVNDTGGRVFWMLLLAERAVARDCQLLEALDGAPAEYINNGM